MVIFCYRYFKYIWNTQTFQNTEWLKLNIKQTLRDQFIQLWLSLIQNPPKALNYRIFKEQFETENYLHILDDNFVFEFCKSDRKHNNM